MIKKFIFYLLEKMYLSVKNLWQIVSVCWFPNILVLEAYVITQKCLDIRKDLPAVKLWACLMIHSCGMVVKLLNKLNLSVNYIVYYLVTSEFHTAGLQYVVHHDTQFGKHCHADWQQSFTLGVVSKTGYLNGLIVG